ncbi:hypothetical protein, partial [Streptomyces sp. NPDC001919]
MTTLGSVTAPGRRRPVRVSASKLVGTAQAALPGEGVRGVREVLQGVRPLALLEAGRPAQGGG